ncbi:MAG: hypothetical protein WKG06_33915 [Segetibacter sp.]
MNQQSDYPKIGIRPIIDGRLGGVRESLEETTMKMAQNVAALYEKELRYPNGTAGTMCNCRPMYWWCA